MARWRVWGNDRAVASTIAACVVLMTLCIVLGTPRNGGPDEPAHGVASGALVRGQRPLVFSADVMPNEVYQMPGNIGRPEPGCFALKPSVTASCADSIPIDSTYGPALSSAAWYPVWGHIAPGVASLVPWPDGYPYLARAFGAALPVALLIGSLLTLRRRGNSGAIAALVGFTPIAWFSLGVVNPSSMAITGGLALWVGLLDVDWRTAGRDATIGWLAVAGFAALELSRRDGSIWGSMLVTAVCISCAIRPSRLWFALSRWARVIVVATVVLQAVSKIEPQAAGADLLLAAAPLGIVAVEFVIRGWQRASARFQRRNVVAGSIVFGVGVACLGLFLLDRVRPDGLRLDSLRIAVSATSSHLRQLVGLMGWLDAPTPDLAIFMWWALIGMLLAIAMITRPRSAAAALLTLVSAIVVAWALEIGASLMVEGMWQGRYSLPITVGVPLLLAVAWIVDPPPQRVIVALAVGMWLVINFAFMNTQRRWAVGVKGSLLPWESPGMPRCRRHCWCSCMCWRAQLSSLPALYDSIASARPRMHLPDILDVGRQRVPGGGYNDGRSSSRCCSSSVSLGFRSSASRVTCTRSTACTYTSGWIPVPATAASR